MPYQILYGAFIDYVVRHLQQFIYVRKKHNKKIHRHKKKSVSLFQLKSIQYKQFPQKKRKKKKKGSVIGRKEKREKDRDKGERQNEEMTGKGEVENRRRRKGMEGV